MSIKLPAPIAAFFDAESRNDAEALSQSFADDAVVRDEGQVINGRGDIKAWHVEAKRKYKHTTEPLAIAGKEGRTIVTGRLSGNFPGSPIELRYIFELEGGRITSLEIRP
jgi:ketosteroid isomerase-like protein